MRIIRPAHPIRTTDRKRPVWLRYIGGLAMIALACNGAVELIWPGRAYAAQTMSIHEAEVLIATPGIDAQTRRAAVAAVYIHAKRATGALASKMNPPEDRKLLLGKLLEQVRNALKD